MWLNIYRKWQILSAAKFQCLCPSSWYFASLKSTPCWANSSSQGRGAWRLVAASGKLRFHHEVHVPGSEDDPSPVFFKKTLSQLLTHCPGSPWHKSPILPSWWNRWRLQLSSPLGNPQEICTGVHQFQSQGVELRTPPLQEWDEVRLKPCHSEHSINYREE